MKRHPHISQGVRILVTCIAVLLIAIILLKPHSGLLADRDSGAIELSTIIDEKDFEEESFNEFDPDFLPASVRIDLNKESKVQAFNHYWERVPHPFFNEIFLPPPQI